MKPSEFCKATIYLHLQLFTEPVDRRKVKSGRHGVSTWESEEEAEEKEETKQRDMVGE